jgi:hypothetical protein
MDFKVIKIRSKPSVGMEVKPEAPYHKIFMAYKNSRG